MLQVREPTSLPARPTDSRDVFAIAGPAMLANLTTPLLGIVATAAIGRLGDATLLGGVALAAVIFDWLFWLFAFLRMGTIAFTAQALGAQQPEEFPLILLRGFLIAAVVGVLLIALQVPLGHAMFGLMGGSEGATKAAREYFTIRIWAAPLTLANYVVLGWLIGRARAKLALVIQIVINVVNIAVTVLLVLIAGWGVAGAATAAVIAEAAGVVVGLGIVRLLLGKVFTVNRAALFDPVKLKHMMSVNRDIMIRTASLMAAFLFFVAQGARSGDVTLAANAVLNNFLMIGAFFLDGLANAAEQLCGRACGARNRIGFSSATRLTIGWGFAFAGCVTLTFALGGGPLIDLMTASEEVRRAARDYLWFATLAPLLGVFAWVFDGVYIGATWSRDMRNLMLLALLIFLCAWALLQPLGNTGLWCALLVHYVARGGLQALRYPSLLRASFPNPAVEATSASPRP
jgi:MATE family multidrug resistance protein